MKTEHSKQPRPILSGRGVRVDEGGHLTGSGGPPGREHGRLRGEAAWPGRRRPQDILPPGSLPQGKTDPEGAPNSSRPDADLV